MLLTLRSVTMINDFLPADAVTPVDISGAGDAELLLLSLAAPGQR